MNQEDIEINNLIETVTKEFHAQLASEVLSYDERDEPSDIDFFISRHDLRRLTIYLIGKGFVVTGRSHRFSSKFGVNARKSINKKMYHFDFSISPNMTYFSDIVFTPKFYEDLLPDRKIEKFFRYFIGFRSANSTGQKKYEQYIQENFHLYGKYLSNTVYTNKPLCRNTVSAEDVIAVMNGRWRYYPKAFTYSRIARLFITYWKTQFGKIFDGRGEIIAFVGSDGSGKSTAVDILSRCIGTHHQYMGDIQFRFQPFYDRIWNMGVPFSYSLYFFMYIEQWIRYGKILLKKMKGDIVLTDRWPGFNQNMYGSKKRKFLYRLLYSIFPSPSRFVFLYADPVAVHTRKPELSVDEIQESEDSIRKTIGKRRHIEIKTDNLDVSMNKMLQYVLYGYDSNNPKIEKILKDLPPTVVELSGIFASGKSTTARSLVTELQQLGYSVRTDDDMWREIEQSSQLVRWLRYMLSPRVWLFCILSIIFVYKKRTRLYGRGYIKNILGPMKDIINREHFIKNSYGYDFVVFDGGSVYHVPELLWQYMLPVRYVETFLRQANYLNEAKLILFKIDVDLSCQRTGERGGDILLDTEKNIDKRRQALSEVAPYFEESFNVTKYLAQNVLEVEGEQSNRDRVSICLQWLLGVKNKES